MNKEMKKFFRELEKTYNPGVTFKKFNNSIVSSEDLENINLPEGYTLADNAVLKNGQIIGKMEVEPKSNVISIDRDILIDENEEEDKEEKALFGGFFRNTFYNIKSRFDKKSSTVDVYEEDSKVDINKLEEVEETEIEEEKPSKIKNFFSNLGNKVSNFFEVRRTIKKDEDIIGTDEKDIYLEELKDIKKTINELNKKNKSITYVGALDYCDEEYDRLENLVELNKLNDIEEINKFKKYVLDLKAAMNMNENKSKKSDDIEIEENSMSKQLFDELLNIHCSVDNLIDENDNLDFSKFDSKYATLSSALTDLEIRINNNKKIDENKIINLKEDYLKFESEIKKYIEENKIDSNLNENNNANVYAEKLNEIYELMTNIGEFKSLYPEIDFSSFEERLNSAKEEFTSLFNLVADKKDVELDRINILKNKINNVKTEMEDVIKLNNTPEVKLPGIIEKNNNEVTPDVYKFNSIEETKAKFNEYDKPEIDLKEIEEKIAYYETFLKEHDLSHKDDQGMKQRMEEKLATLKEKYNKIMESKKDKTAENNLRTEKMAFYTQTAMGIDKAIENSEIERKARITKFMQDKDALQLDAEETRSFYTRKAELEALKVECLRRKAEVNKYYEEQAARMTSALKR